MTINNLYSNFEYGSGERYGVAVPTAFPPAPTGLYIIAEKEYNVLSWKASIDTAVQSYIIYRSENINHTDAAVIATITEKDVSGNVHTCWIDYLNADEQGKQFYYAVRTVNTLFISSKVSEWSADILQENSYTNKKYFYTNQTNSTYYSILDLYRTLGNIDVERNVLPLRDLGTSVTQSCVTDYPSMYIDTAAMTAPEAGYIIEAAPVPGYLNPETPVCTITTSIVKNDCNYLYAVLMPTSGRNKYTLYINKIPVASNYSITIPSTYDIYNTYSVLYFRVPELLLSKSIETYIIKEGTTTQLFLNYFKTYNHLIYASTIAKVVNDYNYNLNVLQGDIYRTDVSTSSIYRNFGAYFSFAKPAWMSAEQYRTCVVGTTPDTGLVGAGLNGGTLKGITTCISAYTGTAPVLVPLKSVKKCVLNDIFTGTVATYAALQALSLTNLKHKCNYIVTNDETQGDLQTVYMLNKPNATWVFKYIKYDTVYTYNLFRSSATASVEDTDLLPVTYSRKYKANTYQFTHSDWIKKIVSEQLTVYSTLLTLKNNPVVNDSNHPFILYTDSVTFIQGETGDYTLNKATGVITWINPPANGTIVKVDYYIDIRTEMKQLINMIKFPQMNIIYQWQ